MKPVVRIEPYDPAWVQTFERLKKRLGDHLGGIAVGIEHVGSTAVPGLAAKPIVDIDVIVLGGGELPAARRALEALGYFYEGDLGIAERHAFKAPSADPAHHLYVCPAGSVELQRHLRFRDFLRQQPDWAASYALLKQRLAASAADRHTYNKAKNEFVESALAASQS